MAAFGAEFEPSGVLSLFVDEALEVFDFSMVKVDLSADFIISIVAAVRVTARR